MNIRILSVAALTGMLAATGCGGGSGPGAIAPTTGIAPGGVAPSSTKRSLSISFRIPNSVKSATNTSSATKPKYISPGTSNVAIYLSSASNSSATGSITFPTSVLALSVATSALTGLSGSLALSGNALATTGLSGTLSGNATYSIALQGSYSDVTINLPPLSLSSSAATYTFVRVGAVLTDANGVVLSEGQFPAGTSAVAGVAANAAGSFTLNASGPTQIGVLLNGVPATVYFVNSAGGLNTLGPAVTAYQAQLTGHLAAFNSYELTAYVADYDGDVIPAQIGGTGTVIANNPGSNLTSPLQSLVLPYDASASYTVTSSNAGLTVLGSNGSLSATASAGTGGFITGSTDPIPVSTQIFSLGAGADANHAPSQSAPGFLVSLNAGSIPGTVNYGTTASPSTYPAGFAVNLAATASGTGLVYAALNQTLIGVYSTAGPVSGFTYTSTNYPHPTNGILGLPTSPSTPNSILVNTNPNVVPVLQ